MRASCGKFAGACSSYRPCSASAGARSQKCSSASSEPRPPSSAALCTIFMLSCVGLLHRATHSLRPTYIASAKTTFWNSACSASEADVSPAPTVIMLVYCTSVCSARFLWAQSENSAESMFGRWASALACGFIACCCAGVRSYPIRRRKAGSSRHSRDCSNRAFR